MTPEAVFSPDTRAFARAVAAQGEASDPAASAWVSANAGSGKTKVLIDRVARLLLNGAAPDSVLCVTYTKAAANEMLARLFERLGGWSVMKEADLADALARLQDRPVHSFDQGELRAARALFARALETPGGLRIETLHAFCARVLRRFPLEAGVPAGFQEIEDEEADAMWRSAVEAAVLAAPPDALDLVAAQGRGHGASAGLSALRGARRLVRAFAQATKRDPHAMQARVRAVLGAGDETSETILARVMGPDLPEADLRDAAQILSGGAKTDQDTAGRIAETLAASDPAFRWRAYVRVFQTASGGWRASNPYTKACAETDPVARLFQVKDGDGEEAARIHAADAALKAAAAAERTLALIRVGLPALDIYARAKRARAALDFDDLIACAKDLLTARASADWVRYKLDGGLTHVLLDEAQDTSPDQWALVNALTEEFFAGQGAPRRQDPRTLFVVGDEKQSIYSFQGAAPERFLSERAAFTLKAPDGRTPDMEMSFRSSPEVLGVVDAVFDTDAFEGEDPFSLDPPPEADKTFHAARRANQPGVVELWPLAPPVPAEDADPWDAPVDAEPETSPKSRLAGKIAAEIARMIEAGETVWAERPDRSWARRPMRAEDVLILVRGRAGGLFDALIRALKEAGLPVAGADRLRLTDHIGVQDCLNLVRFALLPEDDLTLAEILRGPFIGLVSDEALFDLAHGRPGSLWDALKASETRAAAAARAVLNRRLADRGASAFEFLSAALDQPDENEETGWDRLGARLGPPARDPVEALLARALAHDASGPASLQRFLAAIETGEAEIKRDLAAPNGAIRVMTVHGAKGLQAPLVVLPDTTGAVKPPSAALFDLEGVPAWSPRAGEDTPALSQARLREKAKALREHRRLLYVALTRAQDRLLIAGAWSGRATGEGRGEASWHAACEDALRRLGADEDEDTGALRWGAPPPKAPTSGSVAPSAPAAPDWTRRPAPAPAQARRTLSPSALAPGAPPVLPPRAEASFRLARGRAIHALLQRLPPLAPERRIAAGEAWLAVEAGFTPEQRAEMLAAALATLEDPALAEIFAPHGRAEAAIVGEAPELPDGAVVNARVDRLVVTDAQVLVADFKTDRPPPADLVGVHEAYLAQMGAYRAVLARAYPGRDIVCALVWTDGPRLMRLPDAAMSEALNKAVSAL